MKRPRRGFTLLEVMLAFVVLATALGLVLGMLSRGLQQVTTSQAETEATLHAQSLLDELGTIAPITPGVRMGDFEKGRYRWRLEVAPSRDPAPPPPPEEGSAQAQVVETDAAPVLYRVRLDVEWGAAGPAQQLHFETLRLRASPQVADAAAEAAADAAGDATADAAAAQRGDRK